MFVLLTASKRALSFCLFSNKPYFNLDNHFFLTILRRRRHRHRFFFYDKKKNDLLLHWRLIETEIGYGWGDIYLKRG